MTLLQSFQQYTALGLAGSHVTMGSFDGVHLGHARLIQAMVDSARSASAPSVVVTFFPHPSVVLRGRQPALYITTVEEKADLLHQLGVDHVVSLQFDQELAAIPASEFLGRMLAQLRMRRLFIGEDFALGHGREGNRRFLEQRSLQAGFQVQVVPPLHVDGEVVSSTRVREALRSGDVGRARRYLGRHFLIPGKVMRGAGRGRRLGIPTANLAIWEERAYPGSGVYVCWADVLDERWQAVTNIGFRPTFEEHTPRPIIETHLLDFDRDLYDQEVRLVFIERLRDERRFDGPEALLEQIARDIGRARAMLAVEEGDNG
ncbi:MAG: bifunctional riboflavin kinase/FAD synthetase [Anaerolineales bacterium]|nr:bifunctional riboflavin kinase/FAD synthetase [Anaerolineales bacterium]